MKRIQIFHEVMIPLMVSACDAKSYLELGTHHNETIGKVVCERRYGVDIQPVPLAGVEMFAMTTDDFIAGHAGLHAPYDFVFIDADHSCAAARDDFFGILPHVSPEGIICLHDTNPETQSDTRMDLCGDSWKFAMELHDRGYESVTLNYHPGLTIARNRKRWVPK